MQTPVLLHLNWSSRHAVHTKHIHGPPWALAIVYHHSLSDSTLVTITTHQQSQRKHRIIDPRRSKSHTNIAIKVWRNQWLRRRPPTTLPIMLSWKSVQMGLLPKYLNYITVSQKTERSYSQPVKSYPYSSNKVTTTFEQRLYQSRWTMFFKWSSVWSQSGLACSRPLSIRRLMNKNKFLVFQMDTSLRICYSV